MCMKTKISQEDYEEIEYLVDCSLSVASKKDAERYTSRLDFMRRTGGYGGRTNIIFSQLVAATKSASGRVSDKKRLCSFARQELYKLKGQIDEEEN